MGKVILGLGYGDEGKGLTTSFLCSITQNPIVVRFNGGHQAGHTVVHDGERHVFSSFGSGTLQCVPTYWSRYCTFYPTAVVNEYNLLKKHSPILYVNPLCPVTTPYDVYHNQRCERKTFNPHGSVGVGFGATIQRQEDHYKLFVQDLFHEKILMEKLKNICGYYGLVRNIPYDISEFLDSVCEIKKIIRISGDEILTRYDSIFEGAQGILLDQDFGFFPNVTRSNTTSRNAIEIHSSERYTEIYYVTRTYQTRHGNGFMTNEGESLNLVNNKMETNRSHEFQGDFRTSPLDTEMMNYALECDNHFSNGIPKNLVITCADQHDIDIDELLGKLKTKFDKVYISNGDSLTNIKKIK